MDKDTTWEMEDYRKMASMAQFMVGAAGGAAASRYATRGTHNKNKVANEELGDFLKLLNRQNSKKLQHWLKPGSLNCKKTC
jgi:hypothetical protein